MDLLSVCNLVNYFGKSDNVDDVTVYPVLMNKGLYYLIVLLLIYCVLSSLTRRATSAVCYLCSGKTKVALYGLGNIRDERLYRTFQQKKVKLMRPVEDKDNWFNIFVLHQNR